MMIVLGLIIFGDTNQTKKVDNSLQCSGKSLKNVLKPVKTVLSKN